MFGVGHRASNPTFPTRRVSGHLLESNSPLTVAGPRRFFTDFPFPADLFCFQKQADPTWTEVDCQLGVQIAIRIDIVALSVERMKTPLVMSWSGGKDSAMALYEILRAGEFEVVALLTSVSEEYKRVSHHGVRETLLEAQAAAIGIPLEKVYLPSNNSHPCTDAVYEEIMGRVLASYYARDVKTVGFGDLFLEDLRAWREKNLAKMEMNGVFPLWKRDTAKLAEEIITLGFKAYLSCVEGKVGPGFVGRAFDRSLLDDLPDGIDPCGEFGEFHSYVYAGPIFRHPVSVKVGQTVIRDGRYYADLLGEADELEANHGLESAVPPVV